jgi:hypothetical protein
MAAINIKRAQFHDELVYTISPNHHPPKSRVCFVTGPYLKPSYPITVNYRFTKGYHCQAVD